MFLPCSLENTFIEQFRLNKSTGSAFPGLSNQFIDLYLAVNAWKSGQPQITVGQCLWSIFHTEGMELSAWSSALGSQTQEPPVHFFLCEGVQLNKSELVLGFICLLGKVFVKPCILDVAFE